MKKVLLLSLCFLFSKVAISQHVLFVNDNDVISYNTDTMLHALDNSMYSNYDYWNIPDSGYTGPTAAYMSSYDLVIWYTSTDGLGLKFWQDSSYANPEIVSYINSGKAFWIIGLDVLYQAYGLAPKTFNAGEFTYDHLGLSSYDNQSYVDDTALGVRQVNKVAGAPAGMPDSLRWVFVTLWYVDGCTPRTGVQSIYQMGPSIYSLAGSKTMFYNGLASHKVMSTFFDPALINTQSNLITFMQAGIQFLTPTSGISEVNAEQQLILYPNPLSTDVKLNYQFLTGDKLDFFDINGQLLHSIDLSIKNQKEGIDISALHQGVYFVRQTLNGVFISTEKLVVLD